MKYIKIIFLLGIASTKFYLLCSLNETLPPCADILNGTFRNSLIAPNDTLDTSFIDTPTNPENFMLNIADPHKDEESGLWCCPYADKKNKDNPCPIKHPSKKQMQEHILTHFSIKTHSCDNCFKKFLRQRDLKKHRANCLQKKPAQVQPFSCHYCCEKFTTREELNTHAINVHHLKLRSCRYCSELYATEKLLKIHVRKCWLCPQNNPETQISTTRSFGEKDADGLLLCPESGCQKRFLYPSFLRRHCEKVHAQKQASAGSAAEAGPSQAPQSPQHPDFDPFDDFNNNLTE